MRLLIGPPCRILITSIDSLSPAGWEEAKLLADRLAPIPVAAYYVSPLGRAKDTASLTLKKPAARQKPAAAGVNLPRRRYHPGKGFRALCLGLAAGCVDGGAEVF